MALSKEAFSALGGTLLKAQVGTSEEDSQAMTGPRKKELIKITVTLLWIVLGANSDLWNYSICRCIVMNNGGTSNIFKHH